MELKKFTDIEATHGHEEELRRASMALIENDPELFRRLEMVQKAMTVIFGYTIEYASRSEDETRCNSSACGSSTRQRRA